MLIPLSWVSPSQCLPGLTASVKAFVAYVSKSRHWSHEVALVNSGNDINTVLVHDLVRMLHWGKKKECYTACFEGVEQQDIVNDS